MADVIHCCDGCGTIVSDEDEARADHWEYLAITKRWRCPRCAHALAQINTEYVADDEMRGAV